MADQPIIGTVSNQTFKGLRYDNIATAIDLTSSRNVTFQDCVLTNLQRTAVALQGCDNIRFEGCVVHGAALSDWANHALNCFNIKNSGNLVFESCSIARAAHECIALLDGVAGAQYLIRNCKFGYLDPQWDGGDTRNNGGSGITLARGVDNVQLINCRFKGMPDGWKSVPKHRVHHRGGQLKGRNGKVIGCLFEDCGGGIKFSSDAGQVSIGWLIEDTIIMDCATRDDPGGKPGIGIEVQAMDGPGTVANNTFRRVKVWNAQQLLHLACPNLPGNLDGNMFEDCEWGKGAFYVTGRGVGQGTDLNGLGASRGNRVISTPPVPNGPPPPDDPTASVPVLRSLTPASGKAGDTITFDGSWFGAKGFVIWTTASRLSRRTPASWADQQVTAIAPPGVATGPVYLRRGDGKASNRLDFTVPPPPPPPATGDPVIASLTPASGAIGDTVTFKGSDFGPAGFVIWTAGNALIRRDPVSWTDAQVTAQVPQGTTTGDVFLRRKTDGRASNKQVFTVSGQPPPPPPPPGPGGDTNVHPVPVTPGPPPPAPAGEP